MADVGSSPPGIGNNGQKRRREGEERAGGSALARPPHPAPGSAACAECLPSFTLRCTHTHTHIHLYVHTHKQAHSCSDSHLHEHTCSHT